MSVLAGRGRAAASGLPVMSRTSVGNSVLTRAAGESDIAPNMAEADRVVGVERDAAWALGPGERPAHGGRRLVAHRGPLDLVVGANSLSPKPVIPVRQGHPRQDPANDHGHDPARIIQAPLRPNCYGSRHIGSPASLRFRYPTRKPPDDQMYSLLCSNSSCGSRLATSAPESGESGTAVSWAGALSTSARTKPGNEPWTWTSCSTSGGSGRRLNGGRSSRRYSVESATWSSAGELDYWVRERGEWWGRVRGPDGHQRWMRGRDMRPSQPT